MIYYNDNDSDALKILQNAIRQGYIPDGFLDDRSILEVKPNTIPHNANHIHLFAGIGGWAYASELAKVPHELKMMTLSCPCQPFSRATERIKRKGFEDERHLWPEARRIIQAKRPDVIFGEQVGSNEGIEWLDKVWADLEGEDYEIWTGILPACYVGAPHLRQRIYFSGIKRGEKRSEKDVRGKKCQINPRQNSLFGITGRRILDQLLGDWLAYSDGERQSGIELLPKGTPETTWTGENNAWSERIEWRKYWDKKIRPNHKEAIPAKCRPCKLDNGLSARLWERNRKHRLKGFGNAIVPQVGALVMRLTMEYLEVIPQK